MMMMMMMDGRCRAKGSRAPNDGKGNKDGDDKGFGQRDRHALLSGLCLAPGADRREGRQAFCPERWAPTSSGETRPRTDGWNGMKDFLGHYCSPSSWLQLNYLTDITLVPAQTQAIII